MAATSDIAVETRAVGRHFGGLAAVEGVTLQVHRGEVLAIAGDNGAGKTTFIRMLAGVAQPTAGEILIDGHSVQMNSAADARTYGIETVHQDLALCPDLTAAENMYLGREPVKARLGPLHILNREEMRTGAQRHFSEIGANVPVALPVRLLSGGQRQAIAIARAAFWGKRLAIFDEPTAALGVAQTERTLDLIREVARRGIGVIVITHNLDDLLAVSDRVAVLRLGRLVSVIETRSANPETVHRLMAGLAA